jgi:photosystem II stability/assembly factor-like uncharacterized protein
MTRLSRGLDLIAGAGRRARFALLMLGVVAFPLAAQPLRWETVGPRTGGISSLATAAGSRGVLWASVQSRGVLRSLDGGASWEPTSLAQPESYFAVVTDPVNPLVVYAEGTAGLARTVDGGATWKIINRAPVGAFAMAPSAPGTLYLVSRGNIATFAVASRSDDGGATWRPLAALPNPIEAITELDVDPADPDLLYAQGWAFHLDISPASLRSTDGGKSWIPGFVQEAGSLGQVQIDRRAPATLYGLGYQGPVRSHDHGVTWELARTGLPANGASNALVLDQATGILYLASAVPSLGQIWRSTDGATTWTRMFERPGPIGPLAVDRAVPGRIYAGAADVGLLASADDGQHWQVAGAGFVPPPASDLVADSRAPGTFYAVVATGSFLGSSQPQLAGSRDGGLTWEVWTPRDPDGTPVWVSRIVPDPFTAGSLYTDSGPTFFHSVDGGKTWLSPGPYPPGFAGAPSIAADPLHAGILFAGGFYSNGVSAVLRSADGGKSWIPVLNVGVLPVVSTVFVDPAPPEAVFAGGRNGFWRSLDGGQTWVALGLGLPANEQWIVRMQTGAGPSLYAELFPSGPDLHTLYRSTDRGATWNAADSGLPAGTLVNDLLTDPLSTALYAGTGSGVFVSQDGGAHWTVQNDGLASTSVNRLAAGAAHGATVLAATEGGLAVSPPPAGLCIASDEVLCLAGRKFAARVHWTLANGSSGQGHAAALTDRSGSFWFFSPDSLELTLKMIDGQTVNHHFWLFGADLTDVAYTLTVTEVATGAQRTYSNPGGHFGNFADTEAFVAAAASRAVESGESAVVPAVSRPSGRTASVATAACMPDDITLCLAGSRFAVNVERQVSPFSFTAAIAMPLVRNTGAFWFFSPQLPELTVKVLDGRPLNGHFWVFLGGLSDINYTVTVTDTATGARKQYVHPAGTGSIADTSF